MNRQKNKLNNNKKNIIFLALPWKRTLLNSYRGILVFIFAFSAVAIITVIFGYLLIFGSQALSKQKVSIFSGTYNPNDLTHSGAGAFIITSLFLGVFSVLFAFPIAFGISIFLTTYKTHMFWNKLTRLFINIFNSTPSIIFGIVGMYLFVFTWRIGNTGFSIMSGILTLMIVILPTMVLTINQALELTNKNQILNSSVLGASNLKTFKKIILPASIPGIITAIMLSFARVISESAPVYLTIGASYFMPKGFFDQGRSLTTEIFILLTQVGDPASQNFALVCGLMIFLILLAFNIFFRFLVFCYKRKHNIQSFWQNVFQTIQTKRYGLQKQIKVI